MKKYLSVVNSDNDRVSMTMLRTSSHQLQIEIGRYTIPKTPINDRTCKNCNLNSVEDELHFLFKLQNILIWLIDFWCLTPLSAVFQLYHGDQLYWWKKPERTTDHGQVECALFCNLKSRARTHAVLVIGLYELLDNPTT